MRPMDRPHDSGKKIFDLSDKEPGKCSSTCDELLFAGKSIGTLVAAVIAAMRSIPDPIDFVFYTPS